MTPEEDEVPVPVVPEMGDGQVHEMMGMYYFCSFGRFSFVLLSFLSIYLSMLCCLFRLSVKPLLILRFSFKLRVVLKFSFMWSAYLCCYPFLLVFIQICFRLFVYTMLLFSRHGWDGVYFNFEVLFICSLISFELVLACSSLHFFLLLFISSSSFRFTS